MSYRDRDRRGGDRDGGQRRPPDTDGMISLKVDNLTYKTTPESLKRVFDRYGEVGDVYIPRDPYTQDSRGFAFVRYYDQRDADDAIDAMDGQMLDGRPLRVQLARHARPAPSGFRRGGGPPRRRRSYSRSRSRSRGRRHRSRSNSKSRSRSAESDRKGRDSHRRDKDRSRSKSHEKKAGNHSGRGNGKKSASRSRSPDD